MATVAAIAANATVAAIAANATVAAIAANATVTDVATGTAVVPRVQREGMRYLTCMDPPLYVVVAEGQGVREEGRAGASYSLHHGATHPVRARQYYLY
jgi:hypothetical protein